MQIAGHINGNAVWKEKIYSIGCEPSGELIIVPKEGRVRFLFGHPADIEEKFEKVRLYYERITADKGDDAYDIVDLRFRDQIVCKDTEMKIKK